MNIEEESKDLYLVFKLNEEIYGTQLLQVREVIESQNPKPIPNTIHSYMGVINVRGEIVGTIDLRIRFGYPVPEIPPKNSAMIIFNTTGGSIAVLTDQLEGVFHLNFMENSQRPKIESKIPNDYILGMHQFNDKIITIIDLHSILDKQEITNLSSIQLSSKDSI
ncbi:hypothetical protein GCL60_05090 [Silvanigrella paludirubra]|uniref:CheW-like domain-containing protein n=1 Tax=Silvanigrella paludirubra TaxID=2499159 RepID=A0A6N6VW30_9BACT|nr:chemotaxis protein CheW [Silvanigrella paludirubra]KAB8039637.1 hypothetical protein GCL60_05090 [Silvanigrella paludirubra]